MNSPVLLDLCLLFIIIISFLAMTLLLGNHYRTLFLIPPDHTLAEEVCCGMILLSWKDTNVKTKVNWNGALK